LDTSLKKHEKEALLKSFFLFFLTLLALNCTIFALYHHDQKETIEQKIFSSITLFNYTFQEPNIQMDIVDSVPIEDRHTLFVTKNELFAYFDMPESSQYSLKLSYDYDEYEKMLHELMIENIIYFLISTLVLLALSVLYSLYALKPLKEALVLLEMFLKDIIHDLNTPITSILLNTKILKKKSSPEAIERINFSAKSIGSLYNNLELAINNKDFPKETFNPTPLIEEKISYFSYLFPHVKFNLSLQSDSFHTSIDGLSRILDNLLSNACKYSSNEPQITIQTTDNLLIIQDNGLGIQNSAKVFERFYKERNNSGLGLGLDIVKKLCKQLDIKISLQSSHNGTTFELTLR
jgi:two-component system OmpR family sensor kinase